MEATEKALAHSMQHIELLKRATDFNLADFERELSDAVYEHILYHVMYMESSGSITSEFEITTKTGIVVFGELRFYADIYESSATYYSPSECDTELTWVEVRIDEIVPEEEDEENGTLAYILACINCDKLAKSIERAMPQHI